MTEVTIAFRTADALSEEQEDRLYDSLENISFLAMTARMQDHTILFDIDSHNDKTELLKRVIQILNDNQIKYTTIALR